MFDIDGTLTRSYDFDSRCFSKAACEALGLASRRFLFGILGRMFDRSHKLRRSNKICASNAKSA
jgi:hypothetical protein